MLTFSQFVEMWKPEKAVKGWMSPSGKAHIIDQYDEHTRNHHPEYIAKGGKHGDPIQKAQAHGFVRFGGNINSMHGFHHFVHYDRTHPEGKSTAVKALRHMKPDHDDDVTVSGTPGIFKVSAKTGKMYKNARAVKELDRDAIVPARHAYRMLQQEGYMPESEHIEFGNYSLEQKYLHYNHLLFGGALPTIPISWTNAMKKASGRVLYTPVNFGFHAKPGSLRMEISSLFKSSEDRLDGILVHEMIHVWFLGVLNDAKESHGHNFKAKLAELQHHCHFQIPVSDDITDLAMSEKVRASEVGVIVMVKNGEKYASFFGKTDWMKYRDRLKVMNATRPGVHYSYHFGKTNLHRKYKLNSGRTFIYSELAAADVVAVEALPLA